MLAVRQAILVSKNQSTGLLAGVEHSLDRAATQPAGNNRWNSPGSGFFGGGDFGRNSARTENTAA